MKPRMNGRASTAKPKRVSMYELSYFVRLMKAFYTEGHTEHDTHFFWQSIETYCPNLMQAINAQFQDAWKAITFTRDISPPESWLIDEEHEQHENSEEKCSP